MFAVFDDQEHQDCNSKVFFYAYNSANAVNILAANLLTDCLALQSGCSWSNTERGSLSSLYLFTNNFIRTMTKNNEVREGVNYSNATSTPNGATTVSFEKFNIEKNAKNRAYAFILHNDLLDKFSDFCKATADVEDLHALCLSILTQKTA